MGLKLEWEWNGGHGVATAGGLRLQVQNEYHPVTWWVRTQPWGDHHEVEVIGDDWRAATLAAQEAAEAAAARLLAEDAGVRALLGLVELRTRAEKAEIDVECYRLAAQHHYKQYTEADTALTRVVTKLGNAAIRVAELEAALRWRSVGEDLPAAGQCVMVPNPMAGMNPRKEAPRYVERYYNHPHRIWLDLDGRTVPPPAHWRPLPPGPEVGQ